MRIRNTFSMIALVCFFPSLAVGQGNDTLARIEEEKNEKAMALVQKAEVAASEDRHDESIRWYLAAIREYPPLAARVACDLGHQYTWAEKPDSAILWYDRFLSDNPGDIEAHLGIARALSWSDRLDEALSYYEMILPYSGDREREVRLGIARVTSWKDELGTALRLYDRILDDYPGDREALAGRAQVINWAGRHRQASALYDSLISEVPGDDDARGGLAHAYLWMGRPDRAIEVIEDADRPLGGSLRKIEGEIQQSRAPRAVHTYSQSKDSDEIERRKNETRASLAVGWLSRVTGIYAHSRISQPSFPDISRDEIGLRIDHRFNSSVAVVLSPAFRWNDYSREDLGATREWKDDFDLFVFEGYATITPRDWVRVDVGFNRGSIDNPVPVFLGLTENVFSAGVDWRWTNTLMSVTALSYSDISDGNTRFGIDQRFEWKPTFRLPIPWRHRFSSNTGAAFFAFDETPGNGYYSPSDYTSLYEKLGVGVDLTRRLRVELGGRLAAERENGGAWFSVGSFEGLLRVGLASDFSLVAGYYNSRSRLDTSTGYEADGFYVTGEFTLAGND